MSTVETIQNKPDYQLGRLCIMCGESFPILNDCCHDIVCPKCRKLWENLRKEYETEE